MFLNTNYLMSYLLVEDFKYWGPQAQAIGAREFVLSPQERRHSTSTTNITTFSIDALDSYIFILFMGLMRYFWDTLYTVHKI